MIIYRKRILLFILPLVGLLTIPRDKMAQASGITNTVRQLGGSLGVAIFATMLTTRVNYHMQMFSQAIQSGSQEFKNVTAGLAYFAQQHVGSNMATAAVQSRSMILGHISTQAFIAGIDDDFWMAALFTFAGLVPVLIMKTKNKKTSIKA